MVHPVAVWLLIMLFGCVFGQIGSGVQVNDFGQNGIGAGVGVGHTPQSKPPPIGSGVQVENSPNKIGSGVQVNNVGNNVLNGIGTGVQVSNHPEPESLPIGSGVQVKRNGGIGSGVQVEDNGTGTFGGGLGKAADPPPIGSGVVVGCLLEGTWSSWGNWKVSPARDEETTHMNSRKRICLKLPPNCVSDFNQTARNGPDEQRIPIPTIPTLPPVTTPIPCYAVWTNWENWARCSQTTTNYPIRWRQRDCHMIPPGCGAPNCQGSHTELESCRIVDPPVTTTPLPICGATGAWGNWNAWSDCPPVLVNPGGNHRVRERYCEGLPKGCVAINELQCEGDQYKVEQCLKDETSTEEPSTDEPTIKTPDPCEDLLWSKWSSWTQCNHYCGNCGLRQRTRICQESDYYPDCSCDSHLQHQKESCDKRICLHPLPPCCRGHMVSGRGTEFYCFI
ncbi:hypothetical protein L596_030734 [Steinernema carpocapsae]|uniref:ShKT domain-containing protein n=1 Tax=Steinernema carpocapsae TaxID=34508 RepID=A0A4U5LNP0_STECR|nr:hypothetical protein L596_030734 [Steinernema carpocapsae]